MLTLASCALPPLHQVLFWIGAPLTLAVALYLAARWLTDPHSQVCLASPVAAVLARCCARPSCRMLPPSANSPMRPHPHNPAVVQEHLHAAWLLPPTACFVCAVVAPFLDTRYVEAAYLWFALAVALAVPLYVLTFNKAVLFNEADDRSRPLK